MAPEDYSTGGGGKLKLKGSKVSDGRVEKKKKKKSSKKKDLDAEAGAESRDSSTRAEDSESKCQATRDDSLSADPDAGVPEAGPSGKTETEKKYEEMRKKRLHDRLARDGIKTHKERVEELNQYLSRLSEHHDMPKIGPG
ncbi:uncharacterized protein N7483_003658 [Penicillium malachiteum]|uniref:uncharacterized protein n=1 Tax=Penicillium malachiteum TaxID=1324776 RepID=UPI0025496F7A|nr:uncharacterized protein N7483_003658 [Penicillium malachiteum]KAJ5729150.1 hypothetical protein N7483_003658 [Penicillium malachiteum]